MLLDTLLTDCKARGWLKARGQQRTDSTHVLAAIRTLNRLECAGETLRAALNALAVAAPAWLRAVAPVEWVERYNHPVAEYRLPKGAAAQRSYAELVGPDGMHLLSAVYAAEAPDWLRRVPAVETLRRVWVQNYTREEERVCWRADTDLPPAGARIDSPYDPEAHYSIKRSTTWTGYKVHVTETCDPATAHLITRVETTRPPLRHEPNGRDPPGSGSESVAAELASGRRGLCRWGCSGPQPHGPCGRGGWPHAAGHQLASATTLLAACLAG